jgi:hypothetical protein
MRKRCWLNSVVCEQEPLTPCGGRHSCSHGSCHHLDPKQSSIPRKAHKRWVLDVSRFCDTFCQDTKRQSMSDP